MPLEAALNQLQAGQWWINTLGSLALGWGHSELWSAPILRLQVWSWHQCWLVS